MVSVTSDMRFSVTTDRSVTRVTSVTIDKRVTMLRVLRVLLGLLVR